MTHCQLTEAVRRVVEQFYEDRKVYDEHRAETFLMRDGEYCGRRFHRGECSAVWFIEEDEVKFYDEQGLVVAVARPSQWELADAANSAEESLLETLVSHVA